MHVSCAGAGGGGRVPLLIYCVDPFFLDIKISWIFMCLGLSFGHTLLASSSPQKAKNLWAKMIIWVVLRWDCLPYFWHPSTREWKRPFCFQNCNFLKCKKYVFLHLCRINKYFLSKEVKILTHKYCIWKSGLIFLSSLRSVFADAWNVIRTL